MYLPVDFRKSNTENSWRAFSGLDNIAVGIGKEYSDWVCSLISGQTCWEKDYKFTISCVFWICRWHVIFKSSSVGRLIELVG